MNEQNQQLDVQKIINRFQSRLSEAMTQVIVLESQVEVLQEQLSQLETSDKAKVEEEGASDA